MQYRHVQTIDGKGALRGIAVDGHGQLYAAGDSEIRVLGLNKRWPTTRPAHAVAVASDGAVYAGEVGQIEIFEGAGKLLHTWRDAKLLGRVTAIGFTQASVLAGDARSEEHTSELQS